MKYNPFLVLLAPIIIFLLFELFFFRPQVFYVSLVLANLVIFFTVRQFTKGAKTKVTPGNFLILPTCFLTSLAVYSTLLTSKSVVQFLFFINVCFIYFYLKNIYYYLIRPELYKSYALENISSYGNFLVIFFSASTVYGLQSLLNIPIWFLIFVILLIYALVIYNVIWANKIDFKTGAIYILIGCLILIEVTWAISFLPLKFNIAGLILAVYYYVLIGLVRFYLKGDLNKKIIKLYLISGCLSIVAILLTSQWM